MGGEARPPHNLPDSIYRVPRQQLSPKVRLKIADDNDLNTAKEALVTMAGFFVSISEEAARRCGDATAFDVLQVCISSTRNDYYKTRDGGTGGRV